MSGIIAPTHIKKYFNELKTKTLELHKIANDARKIGVDPQNHCDIPIAASVAERVEAIMGSISPNLIGSGIVKRIGELENKYGFGDWRIALILAEEISKEKFAKFESQIDAINIGIRTGFAYITQGVVSAPLEGLINIKFKKRRDGKNYLALYYAGPIRGGGATAAAVTTVIADYIRIKKNIGKYDPTPEEIKRYHTEVTDYYERVERKQYKPTEKEIEFIITNLPVELNGDPTSELTVSNHKGLERVETDRIRGGLALLLTDCIPLKGGKVWKQLNKWGDEFGLSDWKWLNEFLELKKKIHSKEDESEQDKGVKLKPNYSFVSEIVAGRPVFTHPLRKGGFRQRYGKSRATGHGSWAISPITMRVTNDYLAIGTQLRVERPGKSTSLTSCDSIEGPIVKLKNGSVVKPKTEEEAITIAKQIDEILFLGDILISPGEFTENNHFLIPAGYCPEWWLLELKKSTKQPPDYLLPDFFQNFIPPDITLQTAIKISKEFKIPLHPNFTYYWNELEPKQVNQLRNWLLTTTPKNNTYNLKNSLEKRYLELIGCPHTVKNDVVVIEDINYQILALSLALSKKISEDIFNKPTLEIITSLSGIEIRDKWGTAIGARMGRPEKAKMRNMKGSPNFLFPVGGEGGRLRSFNEAVEVGHVTSTFPLIKCNSCQKATIFHKCEHCDSTNTKQFYKDYKTKKIYEKKETDTAIPYEIKKYPVKELFKKVKKEWVGEIPTLIKGVRSTMNKFRYVEHPIKGVIRSKYSLRVNKDGTIRYDGTELGITHFTPKEINTNIKKLKELGYTKDIKGNELTSDKQLVEIFPQDIIIPNEKSLGVESAASVFYRTANFVDEELSMLYKSPPVYNVATNEDLIGQLVIGLAPHTSAGIIGRIIGFSDIAAIISHPMWHAAQRRDLDGEETAIMLLLDAFLNFSRDLLADQRGTRSMDAPLVISTSLNPKEVDDEVYDMNITWDYPLEMYEGTLGLKNPWDFKIKSLGEVIDTKDQYQNHGFTHPTSDINKGVLMSAYKTIPTMVEKLDGQIDLANKIRAVSLPAVAELVVNGHFIRDTKGNMRKFTMQRFRCVTCNEKYRRIPISGRCTKCQSEKVIYTISEGSIKKYLNSTLELIKIDGVSTYLRETIYLLNKRIEAVFGRESTKQIDLEGFMK